MNFHLVQADATAKRHIEIDIIITTTSSFMSCFSFSRFVKRKTAYSKDLLNEMNENEHHPPCKNEKQYSNYIHRVARMRNNSINQTVVFYESIYLVRGVLKPF